MLKKILIASCMAGFLPFAATSCTEEDHSSYLEPDLYTQIEHQLEFIPREMSSCTDAEATVIETELRKYRDSHKAELDKACKDQDNGYLEERKRAGSYEKLATEMKNSGYYAGIYIFLAQMITTMKKCQSNEHKVYDEFEKLYNECGSLLTDAKNFYGAWGGY